MKLQAPQNPLAVVIALCLSAQTLADDSTTYGTNAGAALYSTGDGNTLIGASAGENVTYADYNTFVGDQAGRAVTTQPDNVFIGYQAGLSQAFGSDNTYLGYQAGMSSGADSSTATDNSFFGYLAGAGNTTGGDNTFFGRHSGRYASTGTDNAYFGYYAGYNSGDSDDNTGIGHHSLYGSSPTGYGNTALGEYAGDDIAAGIYNTFIGFEVQDNGDGHFNTLIGYLAGANNEHADYNTFVGARAGWDNNRNNNTDDANRNTAFGADAGRLNRDGEDNLALGVNANFGSDAISRSVLAGSNGYANASEAILLGYNAKATATGAIALGANSQASHVDSIALGFGATSAAANTVSLGNGNTLNWLPAANASVSLGRSDYRFSDLVSGAVTSVAASGSALSWDFKADAGEDNGDHWQLTAADGGTLSLSNNLSGGQKAALTLASNGDLTLASELYFNSDARLKTNIQPLSYSLANSRQIQAVRYHLQQELSSQLPHLGLIAQQVEPLFPSLVNTEASGRKTVNYVALVPVLVGTVQQLDQRNGERRARLEQLKSRKLRLEQLLAARQATNSTGGTK